ncbi:hypothetical protein ACJRO7_006559 [Eucalyptus globulus]|uniref:Mitochondrial pyruvate carrier n=1 Tax=Eucalyptus globulus TaxID=34317 RepID=A0ABD3IKX5_EUCGL
MAASKFQAFWNHPAGPNTIHFWAPLFKWGITIANLADLSKPPEEISYPQQSALTINGLIWARYSSVITPKNWTLLSSSLGMASICTYQLARKLEHEFSSKYEADAIE